MKTENKESAYSLLLLEDLVDCNSLRESAREINKIIDSIGDLLFIIDKNHIITRVNKATCDAFKKKPEELIGKHCFFFMHGTDSPWCNCPATKTFKTKQVVTEEVNDPNSGIPLLITTSPILDEQGEVAKVIHIAKDITKIKAAEMEIHIAANLFDAASDSILVHDMDGRLVYFNEAAYTTRGYTRNEFQGLSLQDLEVPGNPRFFGSRIKELLDKGEATFETVTICKDKKVVPIEIHAKVIESDGRKMVLSMARGISERRRIEASIKESEAKFKSIVENSSDQIFMLDRDCRFLLLNKIAADLFGMSPEEMVGRSISEVLPETIATQFSKNIKNVMDSGESMFIDEKMVVKGLELQVSTSLNPVRDNSGRVRAVTGIVRDITESKRAENRLQESEERFRAIFDEANDGILVADVKTKRFILANPMICEVTGYSSEELLKLGVGDIHPKKDLPYVIDSFTKQAEREISLSMNIPVLRKDGRVVYCDVSSKPIKMGSKECLLGLFRDATERKKAEEAVSASLKRYQSFIEVTGELGWITNAAGEVAEDVPSFRNFTGQTYDEIKGYGWTKAIHPDDLKHATQAWQAAVAAKTKYEVEYRLRRRDGAYRNFMARGAPILEEDGQIREWVGTCIDISERIKAEEALNRAMDKLVMVNEKLNVVGSLTRHDVRNKLSAVTGYAYLLRKKHAGQADIIDGLDKMEQSVKDSMKIFDFAKMYEQLGVEELTYVNVEAKLNEAAALFSGPLPKILNECHGLNVLADSFLRQLLYNFIDNTRKHGKKAITIRVHYEKADQDRLKLVYEDDGIGIPLENKASLFKEGFSTGGSNGFGLFLIRKMMNVYGWTVQETGEPGKGAQFIITIPKKNPDNKEGYQLA